MDDPITWKVEGSPNTHSIPSGAVVRLKGKNGFIIAWIDKDGWVNMEDERTDQPSETL